MSEYEWYDLVISGVNLFFMIVSGLLLENAMNKVKQEIEPLRWD